MKTPGRTPVLFLAEGDPETWHSFSGCSRSVVMAMRRAGASVTTADVDLYGFRRAVSIAAAFALPRRRWVQRFNNGRTAFALKTRLAGSAAAGHLEGAPVIQAGATFDAWTGGDRPLYALCDANAAFAARGGEWGPLSFLSDGEISRLVAREAKVYAKCRRIFAFTEALRQSFIADFGIPADRVLTTYQGPNLTQVPRDDDLNGSKSGTPTILFLGRQFERKGGPTLVAAFPMVRQAIPNARLVIGGTAPQLPQSGGIEVVGRIDPNHTGPGSLRWYYLQADVYCMPSRYEPFGSTYCEAMLHGLPCIGRRPSEVIEHGVDGWLVDRDDPEELAAVLIEALRDRERLRSMGLAGRQKVLRLFNWDRAAEVILTALQVP